MHTYNRYEKAIEKLKIVNTQIIKKAGKSYVETTLKDVSELKQGKNQKYFWRLKRLTFN